MAAVVAAAAQRNHVALVLVADVLVAQMVKVEGMTGAAIPTHRVGMLYPPVVAELGPVAAVQVLGAVLDAGGMPTALAATAGPHPANEPEQRET